MFDIADRDIKFLPGVGPQRAALLEKELNIRTYRDLLYYFPYKYIDRSRLFQIRELVADMPYVQLSGEITSFETVGEGYQKRLVAHFTDGTGEIDLVWFKGLKYVTDRYKVHTPYVVFGKPSQYGTKINIAHPDLDAADKIVFSTMGMQPYYNTTEKMKRAGLNSRMMEKLTHALMEQLKEPLPETLPECVLKEHKLAPLMESLRTMHYPNSDESVRMARYRLKFEELFYVQLNILRYTHDRRRQRGGFVFPRVGELFNGFYHDHLPFALTNAQKRVLREIRQDMGSGKQMNRLLQGDVGSGKTMVALMSALLAVDNHFQVSIMAPTEILAEQHAETFAKQLEGLPVKCALLTGSVKGKKREAILKELAEGEIQILIGTHALLEDTVKFHNLGLVVIDEQHRFGVAQRARLWNKNVYAPHVLVMTATPIPRTLAMTLYGDLDVSVIDELPPGRKPVKTLHQYDAQRVSINRGIRQQIEQGRQVYVVYPLIKESEKIDLKNLEEGYRQMVEDFPDYEICMVHGKMTPAEKEAEMQRFANHETHIMVATTVIEVGVNVPNASVMVIENAERFGLSQLHQLRGRVGRGADQSYCILVTGYKLSEDTRKRIEIMTQTNDGFEIAEADLKLRGPGDLEGTQQSGLAFNLRIANLAKDGQLLAYVRDVAARIVEEDPDRNKPEYALAWSQLQKLRKNNVDWSSIS
ncbi:MAG: ATP-dependent DNA helicase RecG [Bacteroidaceae bacterium]|nr:ATP-dependent DNA helicase RecG [Bacteroidaceae bacterium]